VISGQIIFIAPLDWGLGHASRCIPLIRRLSQNNQVIVGVTDGTEPLFTSYLPEKKLIRIPAYDIRYSSVLPVWLKIITQLPKVLRSIRAEKKAIDQIVKDHGITMVISDNRPGLYSKSVHSVYITHQLRVKIPLVSVLATGWHRYYMHKFNEVWVPDFQDRQMALAGEMSDSRYLKVPVTYMEPQSALEHDNAENEERYDYLILLSGVEPQRSILENKLIGALKNYEGRIVLIRGTSKPVPLPSLPNFEIHNFVSGDALSELIRHSRTLICRSGYSTLMDMYTLRKDKLILIPTPGQTEQIYLADLWKKRFNAKVIPQDKVNAYTIRIHSLPAPLYTS
jgi:hypothetical protein